MNYQRVIPRDLFNEAKLLKCLGQLSLAILDRVGVPEGLELTHNDEFNEGFLIFQSSDDGSLLCSNLECTYKGRLIGLRSAYNSKDAYPLWFVIDDETEHVFDEGGNPSREFLALLAGL